MCVCVCIYIHMLACTRMRERGEQSLKSAESTYKLGGVRSDTRGSGIAGALLEKDLSRRSEREVPILCMCL